MTRDLEALYGGVIRDHRAQPRNFRAIDGGRKAEGANPLCGDRLTVYVRVEGGTILDVSFQGFGCAIAMASASLMTERVKGRTVAEAGALAGRVRQMVGAPVDAPVEDLGDLAALAGVRPFPVRVKCAMLPWQALHAAVTAEAEVVSTE